VFLSVSFAVAERELQGTRDTTPVRADFRFLGAAAPALASGRRSCGNGWGRSSPFETRLSGARHFRRHPDRSRL